MSAAALLGVLLRTKFLFPRFLPELSFGNLLHGHSHSMFFGWLTLSLAGAIYRELERLRGEPLPGQRWIRLQWWGTVVATAGAYLSFSLTGYSPVSIALATVNMLLWYLVTAVIWRATPASRPVWVGFYRAASAYLALSTLGTWLLTVLQVTGNAGSPLWSTAPVYFYLSNFIDGWAVLGVTGLLYQLARPLVEKRGLDPRLAERHLRWQVVLTLPAYFHYLSGLALPPLLRFTGAAATVLLLVPTGMLLYNLRAVFQRSAAGPSPSPAPGRAAALTPGGLSGAQLFLLRGALTYAALKSATEALSVLPGLDRVVYGAGGRQWVVAGLHVTLLGFVSLGLMAGMVGRAGEGRRAVGHRANGAGPASLTRGASPNPALSGISWSLATMLAFLALAALGPQIPAFAAHYRLWFGGAWMASLVLWASLSYLAGVAWLFGPAG